jgi:hypothetical protein
MSEYQNENLEALITGGAPQVAQQVNPQEPGGAPQEHTTTGVFEQGLQKTDDFQHLPPAPGSAPPVANSVEDHIKLLESQLAALRNPPKVEVTQEQAKLLTAYDPVKGWSPHTEEEIAWLKANDRQIPTPKNGKLRMRAITPMWSRLKRIAAGLPEQPPQEVLTSPTSPPARPGPPSRQIFIMEISEEYEGPLKSGEHGDVDTFESAAEAARLLGVTAQALSGAIKKAAGKPWTVRGVTMQYLDLYIADDSNFSPHD